MPFSMQFLQLALYYYHANTASSEQYACPFARPSMLLKPSIVSLSARYTFGSTLLIIRTVLTSPLAAAAD